MSKVAGHPSARSTSARLGDYFDNGSVQHLSHVILDLIRALPDSSALLLAGPTRRDGGKRGSTIGGAMALVGPRRVPTRLPQPRQCLPFAVVACGV